MRETKLVCPHCKNTHCLQAFVDAEVKLRIPGGRFVKRKGKYVLSTDGDDLFYAETHEYKKFSNPRFKCYECGTTITEQELSDFMIGGS